MMKLQHKIIIVLLAFAVLFVGFLSYRGLNGMGFHYLLEEREKGTVEFWYTNEQMTDYYNNVASIYNKENKDVDVVPRLVDAAEYLEHIYQASTETEEFPDLYVITNDVLEKAYLSGLTFPVEDAEVLRAQLPQVAVKAATYDDMLLGYPLYYDTSTLVYNKTLLEGIARNQLLHMTDGEAAKGETGDGETAEAKITETEISQEEIDALVQELLPETVEELLEFAANIDAPEGMETIFKWNINDVFFNYFYLGEYISLAKDNIDIYNDNTAACMEIFKQVTQYFYMDAETVTTDNILEEFMQGKTLFTILDSESAAKLEKAAADGQIAFSYNYALVPDPGRLVVRDEEGNHTVLSDTVYLGRPLSTTSMVVVSGYAKLPHTAADFAKYLTTESKFTSQLFEKTGFLPVHKNAASSGNMESIFRKEYEESVPMPNQMTTSNFWMLLERAFNELWEGGNVQEVLQEIEETLKKQVPNT